MGGLSTFGPVVSSKQDTHFFDVFSLIIGLLVIVAILIFALARYVGSETQKGLRATEPEYLSAVTDRIQPFSREAIAGHDNAALAIHSSTPAAAAGSALPIPKDGKQAFEMVCSTCHGKGIAGAPKAGNAADWDPRIAEGLPALYQHALHGFQSNGHVMPPKGGRPDIPDAVVEQAVRYMVGLVKH